MTLILLILISFGDFMAFVPLSIASVASGQAIKSGILMDRIRLDFDDHESRISTTEIAVNANLDIERPWNNYSRINALPQIVELFRSPIAFTITAARIWLDFAGTSGTTEVDILRSAAGGGAFASIFSTLPSLAFGVGDYAVSTNQVLSFTNVLAGDILQFKLTSKQAGAEGSQLTPFIQWEAA